MQEKRVWNRLKDEELIETLKSMEASSLHPVKTQKIYEALKDKYGVKDSPCAHTVGQSLRRLLGQPEKLDEIIDKEIKQVEATGLNCYKYVFISKK